VRGHASLHLRFLGILSAAGATPGEDNGLLLDLAADQILHRLPVDVLDAANVDDPVADRADEMGVSGGVGVEVGAAVIAVDFFDQPLVLEDPEVPIDGAEGWECVFLIVS
jgi:hypothetical protein